MPESATDPRVAKLVEARLRIAHEPYGTRPNFDRLRPDEQQLLVDPSQPVMDPS
ncbi:hypothetical protein [Streptomyces arenae]|uniref:hypothetical protein n=1 Tax=Streptomyces arenae TaxID=29301 RepID=UPI00265A1060|nr:hypothetical protein [Streptomyces arenae]MCG7203993.1 hypothetical protein [Streptomyces arenae]